MNDFSPPPPPPPPQPLPYPNASPRLRGSSPASPYLGILHHDRFLGRRRSAGRKWGRDGTEVKLDDFERMVG
ncbi:unnamed protein product [Musa acuminata subsp. malaccensis]|uniref:(wild Malaysian banana) hypothetical protein n=1 Tax=Musa acuminata subsp. malaccensis TaxID=214687 RepID=A0A804JDQ2_MUSAM|nr:unnamed protein product [Musa acuminata subsp. malaccensis]